MFLAVNGPMDTSRLDVQFAMAALQRAKLHGDPKKTKDLDVADFLVDFDTAPRPPKTVADLVNAAADATAALGGTDER